MNENIDQALDLLKGIASRNRLMILCQLVEGEQSVGELARTLDLRGTVVSQHLGLLRRDGMVKARRDGQTMYYSLQGEAVRKVLETLYNIFCVPAAGTKEDASG